MDSDCHTDFIITSFQIKTKGTFVRFMGQGMRYHKSKGGHNMMQSGLMRGFSLVLGMVCMACALRDMLRQRKEVLQEEWEESNVIYVPRQYFLSEDHNTLCRF